MDDVYIKRGKNNLKRPAKMFLSLIFLLAILIISIQLISAVEVEMNSEFLRGETLIAKISGNFIDAPGTGNILFYREHVRVPMQFNFSKISDEYYLYALLSDKVPGNYSLQIQDVEYKIGVETSDETIIKNFTIINETADFYVVPGYVKVTDDFYLELTNLQDRKINVEITLDNASDEDESFFESLFGTGSTTKNVELSSGQTKKVDFVFDNSLNESTLKEIKLETENNSYSVPVYMEINKTKIIEGTGKLTFEPSLINVSLATDSKTTRIIYLNNKEDISVKNISVYVSDSLEPYVNLSVTELDELEENSSIRIELNISSGEDEKSVEGQIIAKYENNSEDLFAYFTVFLGFIEDYVPKYEEENITVINTKTCSELNGTVCGTEQQCSGESVYAKDNKCCLDLCEDIPKSSTKKYIGWGLVALAVIFVLWFLMKRYKKTNNPVDLLKEARGRK